MADNSSSPAPASGGVCEPLNNDSSSDSSNGGSGSSEWLLVKSAGKGYKGSKGSKVSETRASPSLNHDNMQQPQLLCLKHDCASLLGHANTSPHSHDMIFQVQILTSILLRFFDLHTNSTQVIQVATVLLLTIAILTLYYMFFTLTMYRVYCVSI